MVAAALPRRIALLLTILLAGLAALLLLLTVHIGLTALLLLAVLLTRLAALLLAILLARLAALLLLAVLLARLAAHPGLTAFHPAADAAFAVLLLLAIAVGLAAALLAGLAALLLLLTVLLLLLAVLAALIVLLLHVLAPFTDAEIDTPQKRAAARARSRLHLPSGQPARFFRRNEIRFSDRQAGDPTFQDPFWPIRCRPGR